MHYLQTNYKRVWPFYPIAFLIFIWPYGWSGHQVFGPWRFLIATFLITLCAAVFFPKNWPNILGLAMRVKHILACVAAAIIALSVFYFLIHYVINDSSHDVQPFSGPSDYFGRFPTLSWIVLRIVQPLNEEIVLRALLLGLLAKITTHRAWLAIVAALVFAGLHYIFYYYGAMNTQLDILALATLFFFGFAANSLFLTFNHIGYGFVIHFAWNWWRFSGDMVKDTIVLNEAQTFNVIEGSIPVFVFVAVLSVICLVGLAIHESRRQKTWLI